MLHSSSSTQPQEVLSHWYVVVEALHFSAQEFYAAIETELAAKKMPQLKISRVEYYEGGLLSAKREYLRLARERLAFDVCAAPFGRDFFFSLRFVEKPRGGWLELLARLLLALLVLAAFGFLILQMREPHWGIGIGLAIMLAGGWLIRPRKSVGPAEDQAGPALKVPAFIAQELADLDSFFLNLPVIGPWYETRRELTYFRHDTRLLYHTIVSGIVKAQVERISAAKGVQLLRSYDYDPILGELYRPKEIRQRAASA
ncbi:MAG: hypothetical protein HZA93_29505 [Verrucomicrobia bacterium]|nr:hypothetical protein [Verrucomicrobiota bacterium]